MEEELHIVQHLLFGGESEGQSPELQDQEFLQTIEETAQQLLKAYWLLNRRGRMGVDAFNIREAESLKSLAMSSAFLCGRRSATEADALVAIWIMEEMLLLTTGVSLLSFRQLPTPNIFEFGAQRKGEKNVRAASRHFYSHVLSLLIEP